jgi:hypothetical protein
MGSFSFKNLDMQSELQMIMLEKHDPGEWAQTLVVNRNLK